MTDPEALDALISGALAGSRREVGRLLSIVENQSEDADTIIARFYPRSGQTHTIGVTGAPGSGKSTLIEKLALAYRSQGQSVAIVAVDPSSPYTGGALLGDRIRMPELAGDANVFMRSMASRGNPGGLAQATADLVTVLDACGFERVLVETVGAGQSDVAVSEVAHTTLLVNMPEMGDQIQMLKAGILESADILLVNKCDLSGAQRTASLLQALLETGPGRSPCGTASDWVKPVLCTCATEGQGIEDLVEVIEAHRHHIREGDRLQEKRRRALISYLRTTILAAVSQAMDDALHLPETDTLLDRLLRLELDPRTAAKQLLPELTARLRK
jgi:LAO/AO transport system kinase